MLLLIFRGFELLSCNLRINRLFGLYSHDLRNNIFSYLMIDGMNKFFLGPDSLRLGLAGNNTASFRLLLGGLIDILKDNLTNLDNSLQNASNCCYQGQIYTGDTHVNQCIE
jgi:hypothetical protein